jgi:hypothetical protein
VGPDAVAVDAGSGVDCDHGAALIVRKRPDPSTAPAAIILQLASHKSTGAPGVDGLNSAVTNAADDVGVDDDANRLHRRGEAP